MCLDRQAYLDQLVFLGFEISEALEALSKRHLGCNTAHIADSTARSI